MQQVIVKSRALVWTGLTVVLTAALVASAIAIAPSGALAEEATVTPTPTSTPVPTETPLPTATPTPTDTPAPDPLPSPEPAAPVVSRVTRLKAPANGALVGVFKPPAPYDGSALDTYTAVAGKEAAIVMWFQPWTTAGGALDVAACERVLDRGAVPLITWEPWNPGIDANYVVHPERQSNYQLADILEGDYDEYIRSYAKAVKSVNGPVMLRPMHEMNGSWYPWSGTVNGNSAYKFRSAWRRIHRIFEQEGASNAVWVWSVNCYSSPNTYENRYAAYYPGDEYVDWTSASGFNWGTTREGLTWRSFDQIYSRPLAYLKTLGKPIALSEFGTVGKGGDKPAWIKDAYKKIRTQHPQVKAVIYYDKKEVGLKGTQDWRIASTSESAAAYRSALSASHYIGGLRPLGTPVAPAEMSPLERYTIYGYVEPVRAPDDAPIRIYRERLVDGAWKSYGYVSAETTPLASYGRYSVDLKIGYTGKWRLRAYRPADDGDPAMWSHTYDYVTVRKPLPTVSKPVAPSKMYTAKSYTVYGYLKPRHAKGTYPVRIYKWRYVSGRWKSYGYVTAKASDYGSYTKYSRSVRLSYSGKWRLRAYAPADAEHSAAWSSGYDYVTVP